MVRATCSVYKGILVTCHDMSFSFFLLYFLKVSSILDTQVSVLFRTLVHSLPHKWKRVARPKVALRRYRDYFHLMILVSWFFMCLPIVCFLKFALSSTWFISSIWLLFVWLRILRRAFGRAKYYSRPSLLFCQPSLAYSNITPTVSRHSGIAYRKFIFLTESGLFLLSALIDLTGVIIDHYLTCPRTHVSVLQR